MNKYFHFAPLCIARLSKVSKLGLYSSQDSGFHESSGQIPVWKRNGKFVSFFRSFMGNKPQKEKVLKLINITPLCFWNIPLSYIFRSKQPRHLSLAQSWPSCFQTLETKVFIIIVTFVLPLSSFIITIVTIIIIIFTITVTHAMHRS